MKLPTKYKVFLPYGRLSEDEMPFHWLCYNSSEKNLKGKFSYDHGFNGIEYGSDITFDLREDMELFVLMWGEYL